MISQRKNKYIYFSFLGLIFLNSLAEQDDKNQFAPKVAISAMDYSRGAQFIECGDGCNSLEIQRLNNAGIYPICVRLYNQDSEPVVLSGKSFRFASFNCSKVAESFYGDNQMTPFLGLESAVLGSGLHFLFPDLTKYMSDEDKTSLSIPCIIAKYSNLLFGMAGGLMY